MLKAVFFDLDDTLCDDAGVWLASAQGAARDGLSDLEEDHALRVAEAFLVISERYWMSLSPLTETRSLDDLRAQQWRAALIEAGVRHEDSLARRLADDYGSRRTNDIALFPDVLSTLRALKARGLCLALITNGVQLTHLDKIAFLGLEAEFDHVLIADAVGFFKPDQRIYQHALKRCGCRASESAMVGDHYENDVLGAQAVGIRAFWYNPQALPVSRGTARPQGGMLRTLSDLLGLLPPDSMFR